MYLRNKYNLSFVRLCMNLFDVIFEKHSSIFRENNVFKSNWNYTETVTLLTLKNNLLIKNFVQFVWKEYKSQLQLQVEIVYVLYLCKNLIENTNSYFCYKVSTVQFRRKKKVKRFIVFTLLVNWYCTSNLLKITFKI